MHDTIASRLTLTSALLCGALAFGGAAHAAGDSATGQKAGAAAQASGSASGTSSSLPGRTIPPNTVQNAEDQDWLVVTGKVGQISDDTFMLQYDGGQITVEMDAFGEKGRIDSLSEGDRVTVSGVADTLFFGSHTIEAASVYDHNDDDVVRASATDEEGDLRQFPWVVDRMDQGNRLTLTGTVQSVQGDSLILKTNERPITVNLATLTDESPKKADAISSGQRVRVEGILDNDVFTGMEVNAGSIAMMEGSGSQGGTSGQGSGTSSGQGG